tara:strand:- start:41 stop:928 length:888 start_codon:yes stop_codon:yes gene_type:complete
MNNIKGTGVALITPFKKDKSIDYNSLERLLEHVISNGVDYLVLMGTTGESAVLSNDEQLKIIDYCKKINSGRLPIVLGIGGNCTQNIIERILKTDFDDIQAILSVSPYYNKPSQEGIFHHYYQIAEKSPVPIVMYNVPGRTSSNIEASTTLKLSLECENIIGIKEASGNMDQIMEIILKSHPDFMVISGDDSLTLPMINMGAKGVISVIGQAFPDVYSKMVSEALNNNLLKAKELHYDIYNFYDPLYREGNPSGIKALLNIMNLCEDSLRLPLTSVTRQTRNDLNLLYTNNNLLC